MREISSPDVLVLGAGDRVNINAINLDRVKHREEIDVVWDLDNVPWPFKDNEFRFIEAVAVLEHLKIGLVAAMNECWRILKSGGGIYVKLPYWKHERSWEDPTHIRSYALRTMDWFDPDTDNGKRYGFYTDRKWKVLEKGFTHKSKSSLFFRMEVIK